jgi:aspartyl-tRNA(Asn)/glutamyl-tRNA(Gln) amidotransferase subunit A
MYNRGRDKTQPMTADLLAAPASTLIAHFAARRASPVEVTRAALERIAERDKALNAFCLVDADRALADAARSEARWRAGRPAGLLDGVPVGVKDVFLTAGWPTLRGSRLVEAAGPWEVDAPAVAALRRHGAVLAGKTTTPELGWKGVTDSPRAGITRNPWDPSRTSGGSSGGSAAALAAGMVPLALGTDGGGSIRIPCGFCGLPGIKPTYGRVPQWPASPYGALAHAGPMARTVADVALLLEVLSEPDARDWSALPPPAGRFRDGLDDGVAGLRIAFSADLGHVAVDPEVAALVLAAATAFEALGARVEAVDPGFADPRQAYETLWAAGAARGAANLGAPSPEGLDPGFAALIDRGARTTVLDYLAAKGLRDELAIGLSRFHEQWDLLLTPTLPIAAFEAGRDVPAGSGLGSWPEWTPFTYPFNLSQQPAATVPCGFTAAGLPVGLQIVGRRHADALVLRAARAYEAAHPHPTVIPSTVIPSPPS